MKYTLDFPFQLVYQPEMDSTSRVLRQRCEDGILDEYTVVITDFQTAGRGQRGNVWESEKDKNLMFSFLLTPTFLPANQQFLLSQIISLAIKDVLDTYCDDISIKWPNDIYWRDKKICGMLIEHSLQGSNLSYTIAGIGLNINQEKFLSPAPNPISLRQITGMEHDASVILRQVLSRVLYYYGLLQRDDVGLIPTLYYNALFRKNQVATFQDREGTFDGTIVRVEPSGLLVLQRTDGMEQAYAFKEITYVL